MNGERTEHLDERVSRVTKVNISLTSQVLDNSTRHDLILFSDMENAACSPLVHSTARFIVARNGQNPRMWYS